jgi:hypothetical protein
VKNVVRLLLAALASLTLLAGGADAQSQPSSWYDAQHQAIAIDPYADGYGGTIRIDFNADHSWAGIVDQSLWHYLYGSVTEPGLYHTQTTVSPDGWSSTTTWFGWGERLGTLAPVAGYCSDVTRLASFPDAPTPEEFHYFTDLWDVLNGATIIYVRPAGSCGEGVPLLPEELANVTVDDGTGWHALEEPAPPPPPPPPPPPRPRHPRAPSPPPQSSPRTTAPSPAAWPSPASTRTTASVRMRRRFIGFLAERVALRYGWLAGLQRWGSPAGRTPWRSACSRRRGRRPGRGGSRRMRERAASRDSWTGSWGSSSTMACALRAPTRRS